MTTEARPLIPVIRWASRASLTGRGTPIHQGRKAANLRFGRRVVTLQARGGVLTPSSIILDLPELPWIRYSWFDEGGLNTDRFRTRLASPESLLLARQSSLDCRRLFRALVPHVRPSRGSIANAVLNHLYGVEWICKGLEKAIFRRQLKALSEAASPGEIARRLLGLGYGLTPSGDDFVLGMIGIFYLEGLDLSELEGIITEYDNPFSRTMLEDALEGFYAEPVLALLRHFSRGDCPPEAVRAVQAMGSTSGKDTVAGMLYGLYLSGAVTAVSGKITHPAPSWGNNTVHGGIRS
jgi:Protein of unknown function (DUF2877)